MHQSALRNFNLPNGNYRIGLIDTWNMTIETVAENATGQTISDDAPLQRMPLYVRSGSIVPIGPEIQFTGDQPDAPIELWLYPGQDGAFKLYEEEGDNYNYEQGSSATTLIAWNDSTQQLTLDNRQGSYPGMQVSKVFRVVIANEKLFDPLAANATEARTILYGGRRIVVE